MEREDILPFVCFVLFVVNPPNHYHNAIDSLRKGLKWLRRSPIREHSKEIAYTVGRPDLRGVTLLWIMGASRVFSRRPRQACGCCSSRPSLSLRCPKKPDKLTERSDRQHLRGGHGHGQRPPAVGAMVAIARNIRRCGQVAGAVGALERIYRSRHFDGLPAGKAFECLAGSGTVDNEVPRTGGTLEQQVSHWRSPPEKSCDNHTPNCGNRKNRR